MFITSYMAFLDSSILTFTLVFLRGYICVVRSSIWIFPSTSCSFHSWRGACCLSAVIPMHVTCRRWCRRTLFLYQVNFSASSGLLYWRERLLSVATHSLDSTSNLFTISTLSNPVQHRFSTHASDTLINPLLNPGPVSSPSSWFWNLPPDTRFHSPSSGVSLASLESRSDA